MTSEKNRNWNPTWSRMIILCNMPLNRLMNSIIDRYTELAGDPVHISLTTGKSQSAEKYITPFIEDLMEEGEVDIEYDQTEEDIISIRKHWDEVDIYSSDLNNPRKCKTIIHHCSDANSDYYLGEGMCLTDDFFEELIRRVGGSYEPEYGDLNTFFETEEEKNAREEKEEKKEIEELYKLDALDLIDENEDKLNKMLEKL